MVRDMGRLGGPGTNQHKAQPQRSRPAPPIQAERLLAQANGVAPPGSEYLARLRARDATVGRLSPADFGIPVDPDPPSGLWARGPRYEEEWEAAQPERVAIADLVATQDFLEPETLIRYARGGKPPRGWKRDMPRVALEDGAHYLIDGHHRTAIDAAEGAEEIDAWLHRGE